MKARGLLLLLGLGLALLLAACGGQTGSGGGGGGGGGGGNTITVRQLDATPLVGAYYRTGGGSRRANRPCSPSRTAKSPIRLPEDPP